MKVTRSLMTLIIAASFAVPALAQPKPAPRPVMYKCVDSRGNVYYSDKYTPECGQTQEMNRQGRILRKDETIKPGSTAKPAADGKGKAKESSERHRRDRALTATYTSEEEIDQARDRSLVIPLQAIKTSENRLAKADKQLLDLKTQADRLAGQQKAIPTSLLEEIAVSQKAVSALEAEMQQKKNYAESVRAKYEADKLRYRELVAAGKK